MPTTLGKALRARRTELGMSRHDLVLASGVHEHTILRIETAQTSNPAWQTIAALAATIDLDLNALARPGIKKGPRLEEPGA